MNNEYITHDGLRAEFVQTTREMVTQWLASRPEYQRNIKTRKLRAMIRDARAGKWANTGEPFMMTSKGELINGQHRCLAFLETGYFPVVLLVTGSEDYSLLDIGTPRTFSDTFKEHGIPNYVRASSVAIRFALDGLNLSYAETPSHEEALSAYRAHEEAIVWSIHRHRDLENLITPRNLAYVMAKMSELHGREVADRFFGIIETGIGGNTVVTLRKRLISEANSGRGRVDSREQLALIIKTVNAWIGGRNLKQIRWIVNEPFPKFFEGSMTNNQGPST